MTEHQRLYLVQARSDFEVFRLLRQHPDVAVCHLLHYLQMATELLGKARAARNQPVRMSHRAFVGFVRNLLRNRTAQRLLGYGRRNAQWDLMIRKSVELAEAIEQLAPALNPDGPNPEYPWPRIDPQAAPVEHVFAVWDELERPYGRQFLHLIERLFAAADSLI